MIIDPHEKGEGKKRRERRYSRYNICSAAGEKVVAGRGNRYVRNETSSVVEILGNGDRKKKGAKRDQFGTGGNHT